MGLNDGRAEGQPQAGPVDPATSMMPAPIKARKELSSLRAFIGAGIIDVAGSTGPAWGWPSARPSFKPMVGASGLRTRHARNLRARCSGLRYRLGERVRDRQGSQAGFTGRDACATIGLAMAFVGLSISERGRRAHPTGEAWVA